MPGRKKQLELKLKGYLKIVLVLVVVIKKILKRW